MTDAYRQTQFLDVIDRDEAERRFHAHLDLSPLGPVDVPLAGALGRLLATDVVSPVDVPGFDRSNVDGFAVRVDLDPQTFAGAALVTWLVACSTVLVHVLRAARSRPVEALRYE